ncbi:MAG: YigZ family protein [Calditrichia bacterium]|nr:YigZ family protein [Calditrichia bacterium]
MLFNFYIPAYTQSAERKAHGAWQKLPNACRGAAAPFHTELAKVLFAPCALRGACRSVLSMLKEEIPYSTLISEILLNFPIKHLLLSLINYKFFLCFNLEGMMQENIDFIYTIAGESVSEFKEKKSRFIGFCEHVESVAQAENYLKNLQKKYYDANHHCYAFKIDEKNHRYSDAGEPNGTAGIPIVNAINHFKLNEVIVVVVRYFGGVKLGTGGLTRAYYKSAKMAVENAKIEKKMLWEKINVEFDYQYTNLFQNTLLKFNGKQNNLIYDTKVHGSVLILPSIKESFIKQIIDVSADKIKIS